MDSFCTEQPSLLPPRLGSRRAQGEPLEGHCSSLWQVLAYVFPSCVHLFGADLSPTEWALRVRDVENRRDRDVRSTIIKELIKEACRHQVVLGVVTWPLPSEENLGRVAPLHVWVRVVHWTCPLHELCCLRHTWRTKTCQYVHMNIACTQQPGPTSRSGHSIRFGLLLWTPGSVHWTATGCLEDAHAFYHFS